MKNKRIVFPLALAALLLGLFFLTRYAMPELYTPEWAARHVFWGCALIIFMPCVFGKYRFSVSALAGYVLGLAAGELFGGFESHLPPLYRHYGWLILLAVFAASCVPGIWLERRRGGKAYSKPT